MALPVTFVSGAVLTAAQLNNSFTYVEPGYKLITAQTFTNVATVSMAAGTFTSTYDEYWVVLSLTAASAAGSIGIRVNNAGSARTAANYKWGATYRQDNGFGNTNGANTVSSIAFGGTNTTPTFRTAFTVSLPTSTSHATRLYGNFNTRSTDDALELWGAWGGVYTVAEANDGLTFFPASGTFSGYYRVYGMRQS